MKQITRADIKSNEEYLQERDERRKRILGLKKLRRIQVGDRLSFNFENRETLIYQIQEMMRVEKITDEQKIEFEIETYNSLIPEKERLSATMFIEIQNPSDIKNILDNFQGLDRPGNVYILIDGEKIPAEFEPGHSKENRISAVHYLTFPFTKDQIRRFLDADVAIHVQHSEYSASQKLCSQQKTELVKDFLS